MPPIFGPSASDLEHLRSTVRALGTTSVPGLSAALSWREHKTEKLLAHELARPNTPLVYDPSRRTVRWAVALPEIPAPPPPTPALIPTRSTPTAPLAPAPVYTPAGLRTLCPHCQVALQATGSNRLVVCPECGRLSSARSGGIASPPPSPTPTSAPPAMPGPPATVSVADRKSQELFAAWVTNQPIPCPKCRTPLRHRGIRVYGCPSCGQQVRFPEPATNAAAPPPPEPLPAR
ncbi:MAG: zf-TFIIB domain-containing protein [Thermoplasmata archaeon]